MFCQFHFSWNFSNIINCYGKSLFVCFLIDFLYTLYHNLRWNLALLQYKKMLFFFVLHERVNKSLINFYYVHVFEVSVCMRMKGLKIIKIDVKLFWRDGKMWRMNLQSDMERGIAGVRGCERKGGTKNGGHCSRCDLDNDWAIGKEDILRVSQRMISGRSWWQRVSEAR